MTDEEFLKVYHGGAKVAYDEGHRAGHREGWDQGVTVVQVHDNEFLRGLRDHIAAEFAKAEGDTVTVRSAFLENLISTIDTKRNHNHDSIENRRGRA